MLENKLITNNSKEIIEKYSSKSDLLELIGQEIDIVYRITQEDSDLISNWLKEEKDHMIQKSAQIIFEQSSKYGCVGLKIGGIIIGFINFMPVGNLYEVGSIFVCKQLRNKKLGFFLQKEIWSKFQSLPMYGVTNVKYAMKILEKLGLQKVSNQELPEWALETIESAGKLLPDDAVYINKTLEKLLK